MNAASRLVHQNLLSRHLILSHLLTRKQIGIVTLALAILLSALSIIYTTHTTRVLHAIYQQALSEQNNLDAKYNLLLSEESAWLTQARIEEVAESQLNMFVPDRHSVMVIEE